MSKENLTLLSPTYGGSRFERLSEHEKTEQVAAASREVARSWLFKAFCFVIVVALSMGSIIVFQVERSFFVFVWGFGSAAVLVLAIRAALIRKALFRSLRFKAEQQYGEA